MADVVFDAVFDGLVFVIAYVYVITSYLIVLRLTWPGLTAQRAIARHVADLLLVVFAPLAVFALLIVLAIRPAAFTERRQ